MTNLTQGDDTYNGSANDDIVNGLGGNDTINGLGGDDILSGGGGNDTLNGGADDDQLGGGSGDDTLIGGLGNDAFVGGTGIDTVVIDADAANGMASQAGNQLTIVSVDGVDVLNAGIEHIQFNNVTIDMSGGDALAYLGADSNSIAESGSATGNALSNDIDIDDTITLTGIHSDNMSTTGSLGMSLSGQYGSLLLNTDGSYSYSAGSGTESLGVGESVTDVFTYTVMSGGVSSTQTISIVINGENDTPQITSLAGSATYTDTLLNDTFTNYNNTLTASDVDTNDTLTFGATGAAADASQSGFDLSVAGTYGTLYINSATGDYMYVPSDSAVEAAKTATSDSFTFTVSDGHGGTDSQSFVVQINGVNDKPVLGAITPMTYTDTSADDTFATQTGTLAGTDRDNDTLTYHATGETLDGSQSGFDHAVAGTYGTLYFNASTGAYEYIPNDGAVEGLKTTASETFSFSVSDGALSSTAQTLTVTLNGTNDTPVIAASAPTTELTESGGVNNGSSGTLTSSSTMTLSDRDSGDTPSFDTTALANNGWVNDGGGFWHKIGTYGTATLDTATGHVTYGLNDNNTDTQALQDGDTVHDIFTLYATDGTAGSSTTVDFTIHGSNDAAVISGTLSGSATEAGGAANGTSGSPASGTATDTDVDNPANTFQAVSSATSSTNGYGTYTIDASGHWVFTVNESNSMVQALNVGGSLTDTFTIHTADGTAQTVTVTIFGANDAAVVTGATSGSVTESGGALFSGTPTVSGTLDDTDVDNTSHLFQAVATTASDNGYGTYSIDASGHWSFTLANSNATIQALNDGDVLTETFTVHTTDGTAQVVTITINGHNEVFAGTSGNDLLKGTIYGDTMSGGQGNDTYVVNNTHDVVVENSGEGEDMVQASVTYTLGANVEDLTQSGNSDIDATGNSLDNLIVGNNGNNVLSGLGGDDVIRGGGGNDTIEGGDGDDNMDGGAGTSDTVSYEHASAGVTINLGSTSFQNTGGAGFDKMQNFENVTGSGFDDNLTGSAGRNTITGGGGADTMTSGASIDTFVYHAASDSAFGQADTITDLANADVIDLSAIATDFVVSNSFHGTAHEIVVSYNSGTNITTIAIDMNGDGDASDAGDMQILATGDHHTYHNFGGLGP